MAIPPVMAQGMGEVSKYMPKMTENLTPIITPTINEEKYFEYSKKQVYEKKKGQELMKEIGERFRERMKELRELKKEQIEKIREKIKENIEKQRMLIEEKRDLTIKFENKIRDYKKFRQFVLKHGLKNESFEHAKLYIIHGLSATIDFLNLVKLEINSSNIPDDTKEKVINEIDTIIGSLQEMIERVENTTSPEEIRTVAKDLREYWTSVKPRVKVYGELLVISKFYDIVERAETIGMNIETNATEEVKEMLDTYFEQIEKVREILDEATAKIVEGKDAMSEIKEAREELILAFKTLKDIYRAMGKEKIEKGLALGNRTGQLWAEIEGNASVSGHVVVVLRGECRVDINKDSVVTVVGFEKVRENDIVTYSGSGLIVAKGDVNMTVTGKFKIFVKGKGIVYMEGEGKYRVKPLPEEEMLCLGLKGSETVVVGELQ